MRSFLESEIDMKRDEEQIKSWRRVSDPGPCQARVRRERQTTLASAAISPRCTVSPINEIAMICARARTKFAGHLPQLLQGHT
jgi:hypothetical protein